MNIRRCPRCGRPIPHWQPIHLPCLLDRAKILLIGFFAFTAILSLGIVVIHTGFRFRTNSDDVVVYHVEQSTVASTRVIQFTHTSSPSTPPRIQNSPTVISVLAETNTIATEQKTSTPIVYPTRNIAPSTPTISPQKATLTTQNQSSEIQCPGALPTRLHRGETGCVCTKEDHLILHLKPSFGGTVIRRIATGTCFKILDGPVCDESRIWWYIEPEYGTRNGWVVEGGDSYYTCPKN